MTSIPNRPYVRALGEAGLDVASAGFWVAAAELSPARRRLARGALVAAAVAVALPAFRAGRDAVADDAEPPAPGARSGLPYVDAGIRLPADSFDPDPDPDSALDPAQRRRIALAGVVLTTVVAASVGAAVAGRRLERRWLARLVRNGHPHPHRALGVRMAAVYAAVVVPSRLLAVRQGQRWTAGEADSRK
jgi:hypothetical protein